MHLHKAHVIGAALFGLAISMSDASAAGCDEGSSRKRIACLEKQVDAMAGRLAAATKAAEEAKTVANEARAAAKTALDKANSITVPSLNNVFLQWRAHPGNCLYVEDGTGNVRAGTTLGSPEKDPVRAPTCSDNARQRFDIISK